MKILQDKLGAQILARLTPTAYHRVVTGKHRLADICDANQLALWAWEASTGRKVEDVLDTEEWDGVVEECERALDQWQEENVRAVG